LLIERPQEIICQVVDCQSDIVGIADPSDALPCQSTTGTMFITKEAPQDFEPFLCDDCASVVFKQPPHPLSQIG
jgi:hypothetical protein